MALISSDCPPENLCKDCLAKQNTLSSSKYIYYTKVNFTPKVRVNFSIKLRSTLHRGKVNLL